MARIEVIWECGARRLEVHHAPWGRVAVLAEGGKLRGVWPLPVPAAHAPQKQGPGARGSTPQVTHI